MRDLIRWTQAMRHTTTLRRLREPVAVAALLAVALATPMPAQERFPAPGTTVRLFTAHDTLIARLRYADPDSLRVVAARVHVANHNVRTENEWRPEADVVGDSLAIRICWRAITRMEIATTERRDRVPRIARAAIVGGLLGAALVGITDHQPGATMHAVTAAAMGTMLGAALGAGTADVHYVWRPFALPIPLTETMTTAVSDANDRSAPRPDGA